MLLHIIPRELLGLVEELLTAAAQAAPGWSLWSFRIENAWVRAFFRQASGETFEVQLHHPRTDIAATGPRARTEKLAILAISPVRTPAHRALLAAVLAAARTHESRWEWATISAERRDDPQDDLRCNAEVEAVRAGIKPALRVTLRSAELADTARRMRALGLALGYVRTGEKAQEGQAFVLAVSRDPAAVSRVLALERRLTIARRGAGGLESQAALAVEYGRALGYPDCCAAAHSERIRRDNPGPRREPYLAASAAWVPRPRPRLNNLVEGLRHSLISFQPCSYACAAAAALADAISDAVERRHPGSAAAFDRRLARAVVITADNTRAFVELARGEETSIRAATPLPSVHDQATSLELEALVSVLVGQIPGARGEVAGPDGLPAALLDFEAGA